MDPILTCEQAAGRIARDVDGMLAQAERAPLDAHLEGCAGCRRAIADQRAVRAALQSRPELAVPPRFAERLASRIDGASAGPGMLEAIEWRRWTYILAPVAAGLLLAATLWSEGTRTVQSPAMQEAEMVETLAPQGDASKLPVTALFWQREANQDSMLVTLLTAGPDEPLEDSAHER